MTEDPKQPTNNKSRIIQPNDPMRGSATIHFDLRNNDIRVESKGCDVRALSLAMLAATQHVVQEAFAKAGLLFVAKGGIDAPKTDNTDK